MCLKLYGSLDRCGVEANSSETFEHKGGLFVLYSQSSDPSWDGFPGCHLASSGFKGWQACSQFNGYGNNMHFLPNSTKGKQWSEKWQQHYFKLPPNTYNGQIENDGGASFPGNYTDNHGYLNQSLTMWQDDGEWSVVPRTILLQCIVSHWVHGCRARSSAGAQPA